MADEEFDRFFESVLENIKTKRKELGLTQGQLGERMGKPQSAVARFESGGVKDPGVSMLFHVCMALGIKPGDLVDKPFIDLAADNAGETPVEYDTEWLVREIAKLPDSKKRRIQNVIGEILSLI